MAFLPVAATAAYLRNAINVQTLRIVPGGLVCAATNDFAKTNGWHLRDQRADKTKNDTVNRKMRLWLLC